MAPNVVMTNGRKVRSRSAEPLACLAVLSAALEVMMAWGSVVAAWRYEGRRGQETVKSMATGCSARAEWRTRSTLVPEVREEPRLREMEASRSPSAERCLATRLASW